MFTLLAPGFDKASYVLRMAIASGKYWSWKKDRKKYWCLQLRDACEETIRRIDEHMENLS